MKQPSTNAISAATDSTQSFVSEELRRKEASDLVKLWQSGGPQQVVSAFCNDRTLYRHKSLFLNLVLEDFAKTRDFQNEAMMPLEYCRRFSGLGKSLERSIIRQLEVQQYLDGHPELLDQNDEFVWPAAGDVFHRFSIVEELGRGALARVYLCHHQNLSNRLVVVKIALGGKPYEASLMSKLDHPNIMPIHWADYDEQTDVSFFCMPFLGRSTLVDVIAEAFGEGFPKNSRVIVDAANLWAGPRERTNSPSGRLPAAINARIGYLTGALRLASGLAEALHAAHQNGVIHGDLKPSNVLITPQGVPLLFDFNLGRDRFASLGPAGGTLAYMAPEQLQYVAEGNFRSLPPAVEKTDIYSFGVLLFELLYGSAPFQIPEDISDSSEIAKRLLISQANLEDMLQRASVRVGQRLTTLLRECLAFDPGNRLDSVQRIAARIQDELKWHPRLRRYAIREPWKASISASLLLVFLSAAVVFGATRPTSIERNLNGAAIAQSAKRWDEGVRLYSKVLIEDNQHRSARFERARCFIKIRDFSGASSDLLYLVSELKDPEAEALLGLCYHVQGDLEPAIGYYREALSHGLKSAGLLNDLSVCLTLAANSRMALVGDMNPRDLLEQALDLAPDSEVIHANLVRLDLQDIKSGKITSTEHARNHMEWLCENRPERSGVWDLAVMFHEQLRRSGKSDDETVLACFRKAIELGGGPSHKSLQSALRFHSYRELAAFEELLELSQRTKRTAHNENRETWHLAQLLDPIDSSLYFY